LASSKEIYQKYKADSIKIVTYLLQKGQGKDFEAGLFSFQFIEQILSQFLILALAYFLVLTHSFSEPGFSGLPDFQDLPRQRFLICV